MDSRVYEELAMRTEANQLAIRDRIAVATEDMVRLDNACRGLCGDAGELATAVQRHIEYNRPLDVANVKEEVGDILWRLVQTCKACGFTLEEAMEGNIKKLAVRYPEKYTDALAAEEGRDRVKEREAMETLGEAVIELPTFTCGTYNKPDPTPITVPADVDGRKMLNNMLWECQTCGHLNRKAEEKCVSCSNQ